MNDRIPTPFLKLHWSHGRPIRGVCPINWLARGWAYPNRMQGQHFALMTWTDRSRPGTFLLDAQAMARKHHAKPLADAKVGWHQRQSELAVILAE